MYLLIIFIGFCLTSAWSHEPLPLWEAGAGALPMRYNNFRGSSSSVNKFFPFPAFTIRGKTVEAENGYIRSHLARFGQFTFDLSFSVGLNVQNDGDPSRDGMEELSPTFELGPMVRYYMWKSQDGDHFINLEMPYRAVYATDLTFIEHVGYFSIPYINFLSSPTPKTFGWSSEISFGPMYGSRGFHNRFYAVTGGDVNPDRHKYHSTRGYSGSQFSWVLSRRFGQVLVIPFLRYDYLEGAVFKDSPLVTNNHYFLYGVGLVWFFMSSKERQGAPTMVK